MTQDHAYEVPDVDLDNARQLLRDAIRLNRELQYATENLRTEILGGLPDIDCEELICRLQKAIEALSSSGPPESEERITVGAIISIATSFTEARINDDAWIDGVISMIQQAYAGATIHTGNKIIVYEPPVKAVTSKRKRPK